MAAMTEAVDEQAYLREIEIALPRVLALIDRDKASPTYGVADRQFWAWKLIDFPNGTFQGFANGFAHLLGSGLCPSFIARPAVLRNIEALLDGARHITRRDGSLEEAFPFEKSFCVTALVSFDFLRAADDLNDIGAPQLISKVEETVGPLIRFLTRTDETHGFISNHLATAVASLLRWHRLTGDRAALAKGNLLLDRILRHQSVEGWFPEYDGADPGYQTLCVSYLADVAQVAPSGALTEALRRAVAFIQHFAHPDGSFGGIYGSRNTRLYYPAGVEALAENVPEALALARFMRRSILSRATVPLSVIDQPNLAPVFNNYCWAARSAASRKAVSQPETDKPVPAASAQPYQVQFPAAGLLVDHGKNHHTIVSTHKGGVVYHFVRSEADIMDAGPIWYDPRGQAHTVQTYDAGNKMTLDADLGIVKVVSVVRQLVKPVPTVWNFLLLRLLAASILRIASVGEFMKRALARRLVTAKGKAVGTNVRTIRLGEKLEVADECDVPANFREVRPGLFSAIHMASQGYWQAQDSRDESGYGLPKGRGEGEVSP